MLTAKNKKKEINKMRYRRQLLQEQLCLSLNLGKTSLQKCLEQKTTLLNKEWLLSNAKIE